MDYIGENNFSFGAVNSLKARDAVPIPVGEFWLFSMLLFVICVK